MTFLSRVSGMALVDFRLEAQGEPRKFLYLEPTETETLAD
jgi:hypothetical protein